MTAPTPPKPPARPAPPTSSKASAKTVGKLPRSLGRRLLVWGCWTAMTVSVIGALLLAYVLVVVAGNLPSLEAMTDYQPKVPLRIYTSDHVLIGEFGEERRQLMSLSAIPDNMKNAVLAIEDNRFYTHGGVDFIGILRAGVTDILRGSASQGASTITMQVARNFFLSSEKTYLRKFYEMLLAYKIEAVLSKDQIFELYLNQIYLGQRAYGFAAAARVYFGKNLQDISLAQAAMLAGLPKAPSAYNPVVNPRRARIRQEYILKRMLELRYITPAQYESALNEALRIRGAGNEFKVHAEFAAEMVRQKMVALYGKEAYTRGLNVITTVDSGDQQAAYLAVRQGVIDYDRRHGYRGPEAFIVLPENEQDRDQAIADALSARPRSGGYISAVVTRVQPGQIEAQVLDGSTIIISGPRLRFAAAALKSTASKSRQIRPGALIRVSRINSSAANAGSYPNALPDRAAEQEWEIVQLPQVESALIAMRPQDGAIYALVGGFDFNQSKFNHITQAWRQPGSSFKPFIYSAGLDRGIAPATLINDAPFYLSSEQTGGQAWSPKNYDAQYRGPVTMRQALEKSINLISIRILAHIGTQYAQTYITQKFGFDPEKTPPYLSMALGTGLVTPLQMASAYSVFANGGYGVNPYLIVEVSDAEGVVLSRAKPLVAGKNAPQMLDARNEYIMTSLLQSVAQNGTGSRSRILNRTDLAGKTGTTNDSYDAWFAGFQPTVAAVAWLGYDQPKSLGDRETGGGLALPIWINYMRHALAGVPTYQWPKPQGITEIGGELYYDIFTPGHGFVEKIGMDAPPPSTQLPIGSDKPEDGTAHSLPKNEVEVSEVSSSQTPEASTPTSQQEDITPAKQPSSDAVAQASTVSSESMPSSDKEGYAEHTAASQDMPLPDSEAAH